MVRSVRISWVCALLITLTFLGGLPAFSQDAGLESGESVVTQFSGITNRLEGGQSVVTVIDPQGAVVKAIDLRNPGQPPVGQHWLSEPQRDLATAGQVGQVFGIALDDAVPPNIYLGATSVFGLHRKGDGTWMDGQWGAGGGPGTIWKLNAANGYAPKIFATVESDGRTNSGPAIGNIAFDPVHKQLFVSDLESGVIHAFRIDDGVERDHFDHGVEGRSGFLDVETGNSQSLASVAFDGERRVDEATCATAEFAVSPQCWNFADFRRRVWGLGVRQDPATGETRLYYALWSDADLGNPDFETADTEEKMNSVWSVGLDDSGLFRRDDIRREFLVPPLTGEAQDRFAISDIAFPKKGGKSIMLLGQYRGIVTRTDNSGVTRSPWPDTYWPEYADAPAIRWAQGQDGRWSPVEEADAAALGLAAIKAPLGANAGGGVDFGFGYGEAGVDPDDPSGFVWATANHLCTQVKPCTDPQTGQASVIAEVHGLIGIPNSKSKEPAHGAPAFYAIDTDVNVGSDGTPDLAALAQPNAGGVGDVEVYVPYEVTKPAIESAKAPLWPKDAADQPWWPKTPATPEAGAGGGGAGGGGKLGPDLAIQKAVPFTCTPGKACSFVLVVTNVGDAPYAGPLRVTDTLANQWTLAGFGPAGSTWTCAQLGADVTCDKPNFQLAPGAVDVVNIDVNIPASQVPGVIHNCAVIRHAAGAGDTNSSNDEGCADLTFDGGAGGTGQADLPDLAMSKQLNGACVAGQPCDFTVQITNAGNIPFDGVLSFVDLLPPGWSYVGKATGWWCIFVAGGGERFACNKATRLDPGASMAAVISLRPPAGATGSFENCAEIDWTHNEADPHPENDRSCVTVMLQQKKLGAGVDLKLEKHFTQQPLTGPLATAQSGCKMGEACPFSFDVTITNVGTAPYLGPVIFDDLMPLGWTYEGTTGAQICETKGSFLSCGFGPPLQLNPGEHVKATVTLRSAPLDAPATFVVKNCASLSNKMLADQNTANNTDCDEMTVVVTDGKQTSQAGAPDIEITKSAKSPCLYNIETCQFTISFHNKGAADYDGGMLLADRWLPDGWTLTPPADWKCSQSASDTWKCGAWIKVPAGQTINTQWSFQAPAGFNPSGDPLVRNNCILPDTCVAIKLETGRKGGPVSEGQTVSSEPSEASVASGQQPTGAGMVIGPESKTFDLGIDKTAPHAGQATVAGTGAIHACGAQQPCAFTITIKNQGPTKFEGPFRFIDKAPSGWTYESVGSGWSCSPKNTSSFTCSGHVMLEPGASTSVDISLKPGLGVPASPEAKENCASIDWNVDQKDYNKANDRGCMSFMFVPVAPAAPGQEQVGMPGPDLIVRKQGSKICVPGGECDFVITIEGTSPEPLKDKFKVTDLPPRGLKFEGGGKLGLWACKVSKDKDTVCTYDIQGNPQYPPGGLTSSDRVGFGIQFSVPNNMETGKYVNCVVINFEAPDTGEISKDMKYVCAEFEVANESKLSISKKFNRAVCHPGEECDFTVTVRNEGTGPYTGYLTVYEGAEELAGQDLQKPSTKLLIEEGKASAKGWRCVPTYLANLSASCSAPSMAAGQSVKINFNAEIAKDFDGPYTLTNCVTLQLRGNDPDKLDYSDELFLVREMLENRGLDIRHEGQLTAKEKAGVIAFKKEKGLVRDDGTPDVDDSLSPALIRELLPKVVDASGTKMLEACDDVDVAKPAQISLQKDGPFQGDQTTREMIPPEELGKGPPKFNDPLECEFGEQCTFLIQVIGSSEGFYEKALGVEDRLPEGWVVTDYDDRKDWYCQGTGTNVFRCLYKNGQNPVDVSKPIPLLIHVQTPMYQNVREAELTNCAYVMVPQGNGYVKSQSDEHESCISWIFRHSDLSYTGKSFAVTATGTPTCEPPQPCSFYEFTARRTNDPNARYVGPLKFTVIPPPETRFEEMRFTKTPADCPAAAWSCDRADREFGGTFTCAIQQCSVRPGEEIAVRIDGRVANGMSEPPPAPIQKTACGELEWEGRPGTIDIEQRGNRETARACHTVTILAKAKPQPCPVGQERVASGRCVVKPLDLAIKKRTIGNCNGKDSCRFQLEITSTTGRPYTGKIAIRDTLSLPGVTMTGLSGQGSCSQIGKQINCIAEAGSLAQGKPLLLALDMKLPRYGNQAQLQNCAELQLPTAGDHSRLSPDEVRMLQRTLDHLGFNPGPLDGIIGGATRRAAADARAKLGLGSGTAVDRAFLAQLLGQDVGATDVNPANDRSCISVRLSACKPGYGINRATGQCVCTPPRVERNGACVAPLVPPAPQRLTPRPTVPQQTTPQRPQRPERQPQQQPKVEPLKCIGGALVAGLCICPSGQQRQLLRREKGFRCVPIPQRQPQRPPQQPPQQAPTISPLLPGLVPNLRPLIPQQPKCPAGQVYSHQAGRCINKVQ